MGANDQNNEASFALALEESMSGNAETAAKALQTLRDRIDEDTKSLSALNKAMKNLKPGGDAFAGQMKKIRTEIDAKKLSIAKAQNSITSLGATLDKTKKKASSFSDLAKYARDMPGPLSQAARGFESLGKYITGTTVAIVAAVAGLALLVVATAKAMSSLVGYAIEQQNARRSELLRLEGLTKLRTYMTMYYGLEQGNAKQMQQGIDRVAASSALARSQVAGYGEQLYKLGLRGKQWESALEGMTIKASTQGEAQASIFAGWAQYTALAGGSVDKLTDRVKNRLGGIAKAQLLDVNVQAMKLNESMSALTNSVDISGILTAHKAFNDLFSQSTASGRMLQSLLGKLVQPLIDASATALHVLKIFFQDLIIFSLQTAIAYYELRDTFDEVFGSVKKWLDEATGSMKGFFEKAESGIGVLTLTLTALATRTILRVVIPQVIALGEQFVWLSIKAVSNLVPAMLEAGASMEAFALAAAPAVIEALTLAAPFVLAAVAIWGLLKIFELFYTIWNEVDWGDLGDAIINGMVDGIGKAEMKFFDAIGDMAKAGWQKFKDVLGIQSPSKLFAELGKQIPLGVELGVKQTTPKATAAAGAAVTAPSMPAPSGREQGVSAAARGGGAMGRIALTIHNLNVGAGGGDAKGVASDIRDELVRLLEGVAVEMGAQPA